MQVAVIGAGAVGLGLGSFLLAAGDSVRFVVRSESARQRLRERGLQRRGIFGRSAHSPGSFELAPSIEALHSEALDLVLVCTKSTASRRVAEELQALWATSRKRPPVVLCQNGWGNAEIFWEFLPPEQVWNARIITGFRQTEANEVEIGVHAESMRVGSLLSETPRHDAASIEGLCRHLNAGGLPCEATLSIEKDLLAKLLYNCALNPLGALLGVPYGALGKRKATRALIEAVVVEIFAVLARAGRSTHWNSSNEYLETFYSTLLPATEGHESSMLQDLRAGRETEIDALCGAVTALGAQHDTATPINRALRELIRAIETSEATSPPLERVP